MPIAIADLEVTEAGVSATLSFARVSRRTYIPWNAVYAVTCTNGCGVLYREDMPADVALATPTDIDGAGMMELQLKGRMRKKDPYALRSEGPWLRAVPAEEEIAAGSWPSTFILATAGRNCA
jgi:stringent starvation protein B